ncbi:hypothetical protein [Amycolatopsis kentuckyensis]|uniref:hypothetical protein n=1 Tax=Amycolatopsis kentuckyensis TaxID=218823 RepID=UPI003569E097
MQADPVGFDEQGRGPDAEPLGLGLMVRYWGAFVRQGTPDTAGQAEWPRVKDQRAMVFQLGGSSTVTSAAFAAAQHCDLWNSISYKWLDINAEQLAQQVGVVRQ